MKYLSLEQVIQLHILVLQQTGGGDGLRDPGRLKAVVASQNQEVFGREIYEGVFKKAAALARGIIGGHPFVDGNKRTGMLAAITFITINGYELTAKQGELEDFAVRVAVKRLDVPAITKWLQTHSRGL